MRIAPWRIFLVVGAVLLGLLLTLPNLLPRSFLDGLPGFLPQRQITLGLDLQGGSHLLLEVDTSSVVRERLETILADVRAGLREAKLGYQGLGVRGSAVTFTLTDPAQREPALTRLAELNPLIETGSFGSGSGRELAIAVSPQGAARLELTEAAIRLRTEAALTQSLEVVRRRIDEVGTREASIQRQGRDRILVQVPGERNPENIKRLLGQTAKLTFHMVDLEASLTPNAPVPPSAMRLPSAEAGDSQRTYVVDRRVEVAGENLTDAQPTFQDGSPVVSFRFDNVGARKFARVTSENTGKLFAIVLDNKVISAPRIREPITQGSGIISGSFTAQSATELAVLLRAGALPAPLAVIEERSVGPDLGADSIRAGTIATIVAGLLVIGYMLLYYNVFGAVADLALALNLIFVLALMSLLEATLTLPGIAGIVLTIGQAVDSNVLIYERIREEARAGRSPVAAVDAGFTEATRTIVDANLTSLIAAAALFYFGTGPIKGFAVTLSFGILTNMFTAVTFTRLLIDLWIKRTRPTAIPL